MAEFLAETVPGNGRRPLSVDVFRPAQTPNGVAVVLLHGGGWAQGHRSMMYPYAKALAAEGFVAIAAEYRLLPEAPWPSQLDDVRDVVRWTKANGSKLGIDAAKVALQGYSAGAHLALLVGGTQPGSGHERDIGADVAGTEVAAIVSFFGPARLDADPKAFDAPPLNLLLNGGGLEAARAASPYTWIHPGFPSTFILGGMADFLQPLEAGLELLHKLVEVGVEAEFHYLHSQHHEFCSTPGMLQGVIDEVVFFYRRTLLDREALARESRELNIFARVSNRDEFIRMMSGRQ